VSTGHIKLAHKTFQGTNAKAYLGAALVTKKKIVRDKRSSLPRRSISDEEKIVRDKRSNLFRGSVSGEEEYSQDSRTNALAYFGAAFTTKKKIFYTIVTSLQTCISDVKSFVSKTHQTSANGTMAELPILGGLVCANRALFV